MTQLHELLTKLHKQNEILGKARNAFLLKDAEKKHFESSLMLKGPGTSVAERKCMAEADDKFLEFSQALARLEAIYEFQKLKFTIMEKEFQAVYLEMKLDGGMISKQE